MSRRLLRSVSTVAFLLLLACGVQNQVSQEEPAAMPTTWTSTIPDEAPAWAYITGERAERPEDDGTKFELPGSSASFTRTELRNGFNVADWYPDDHPEMPEIVVHGNEPDIRGCGYCHQPNGKGRPENAPLTGQPAEYIVRQMADFKNGLRTSWEGRSRAMVDMAKAATDEEIQAAANYFSSIEYTPWVKVVETETVPTTIIEGMFIPAEPAGTEPIGQRIMEIPEDHHRTGLRDARSGFIAYAPVGSIEKGRELVTTGGGGKTIRCGICHGEDLTGLGYVPGIAGRSPSYLARQLYDIRLGHRKGPGSALMLEAVANLSEEDIVAIAAYSASLSP